MSRREEALKYHSSGRPGNEVVVFGSGFTGTTSVTYDGAPAWFFLRRDGELASIVPDGATSGPIVVTNTLGSDSSSEPFLIIPPPVVGGFTPASGTGTS